MLPPMLKYQNASGMMLFFCFSEEIHWTRNRMKNSAWPVNPRTRIPISALDIGLPDRQRQIPADHPPDGKDVVESLDAPSQVGVFRRPADTRPVVHLHLDHPGAFQAHQRGEETVK